MAIFNYFLKCFFWKVVRFMDVSFISEQQKHLKLTEILRSLSLVAGDSSNGRSYSSLRKQLVPHSAYRPVYRGSYNYGGYGSAMAQDRYHPGHLNIKNKLKTEGGKVKTPSENGGGGGNGGGNGGGGGGGSPASFQSASYDYSFPPYSPPATSGSSAADTKPDDTGPPVADTEDFKPSIYYEGHSSYEADKPKDSYLPDSDSYGPPSDDDHPSDHHGEFYYSHDDEHHDHDFDEHSPPSDSSHDDRKPTSDMMDTPMMSKPDGMDDSGDAKNKPEGEVHDYYGYPYSYPYYHQDNDDDSHNPPPPPSPPKQKPTKSPPKISAPPPPPPPPPEYYPSYKPKGKPDAHMPPPDHGDGDDDDSEDDEHYGPPSHKPDDSDSANMAPPPPPHDHYLPYKPKQKPSYKPDETYYLPDDDEADEGDEEHHHDHHEEHHVDEEEMHKDEDSRVNKRPYSYYNIGRKLWYVPLYFSVYFIIYVAALILKSVARHKIQYPLQHWKEKRDLSVSIQNDIDTAKEKYA